ncbi:DUF1653 domain-containing protein [Candidatus Saccharibacteria bacterium]|jgi:hypothetical protein|nr:DUF1653 domain-containing protein [Candidatus Saccharibacteria bacterium]
MKKLSEQELVAILNESYKKVAMGARYRHVKTGSEYITHGIGLVESTLEPAVVYKSANNPSLYFIRPVDEFVDKVEIDGKKSPRFEKL